MVGRGAGGGGGREVSKTVVTYLPLEIICKKEAEDEKHFLISCSVYQEKLFECLSKKFKLPVVKMSTENIFLLLLKPPSNNAELQKIIAKHMHDCYEIRKNVIKS